MAPRMLDRFRLGRSGRMLTLSFDHLQRSLRAVNAAALELDNVWDFGRVLEQIAQATGSYACILWEAGPGADPNSPTPSGRMWVLAQWFRDPVHDCSQFSVPVGGSMSGLAIRERQVILEPDIWQPVGPTYTELPFLTTAEIQSACAVPITLADGAQAALMLYRTAQDQSYDPLELALAEQLAAAVPVCYQGLWDRVSFQMVYAVSEILQQHGGARGKASGVGAVLQKVVSLLAQTFACEQIALYLQDPAKALGKFVRQAVTVEYAHALDRRPYVADNTRLAGWVLKNGKPLNLLDLKNPELTQEAIAQRHPELRWDRAKYLEESVRKHRAARREKDLPLLSFTAVPIVVGGTIHGVMRCVAAHRSPYHFDARHLRLLEVVAGQVGQFWSNWLAARDHVIEDQLWQLLVAGCKGLNKIVEDEVLSGEPNRRRVYAEGLRVARSVIPNADSVNVRLIDRDQNHLYCFETDGETLALEPARGRCMVQGAPLAPRWAVSAIAGS